MIILSNYSFYYPIYSSIVLKLSIKHLTIPNNFKQYILPEMNYITCAICCEDTYQYFCTVTNCKHLFHKTCMINCIEHFKKYNRRTLFMPCPMCRTHISISENKTSSILNTEKNNISINITQRFMSESAVLYVSNNIRNFIGNDRVFARSLNEDINRNDSSLLSFI